MADYGKAETHFTESIQKGEELLAAATAAGAAASPEDIERIKRTISDRKGNLAVLKLRQNKYDEAFSLLEQLLQEDKSNKYIMGCVVKQGILGHYYLQQGELKSAERVFSSALAFVSRRDERMFNATWTSGEAEVAYQVRPIDTVYQ